MDMNESRLDRAAAEWIGKTRISGGQAIDRNRPERK